MAIKAHCVVCGYDSDIGEVQFAGHDPGPDGERSVSVIGWSNSLGVTAPEGVGQFCPFHFEQAHIRRALPAAEAVGELRAISPRCVVSGCENAGVPGIYIAEDLVSLRGICPGHARELRGPKGRAVLSRLGAGADPAEFEKRVAALDDTDPGIETRPMTKGRILSALRRFVGTGDRKSPRG